MDGILKLNNEKRILNTAKELFYNLGYSQVTMDDIAARLKMSKKTLYKYYSGKYDIIKTVVNEFKTELSEGVNQIVNDNTLEYPVKLKEMLNFVALRLNNISPVLLEDLQKNLPELWEEINHYKNESAYSRFNKLIEEGKAKNMINDRVNHRLIVVLYANAIQNLLDPAFLNQLPNGIITEMPKSPSLIFDNLINIIYEGILTEEAKQQYRK